MHYAEQASPRAGGRKAPQHSGAPQDACYVIESQHAEQPRQCYSPEGQQSPHRCTSHSQDQLQDVPRSHLHTQNLSHGVALTPDHPGSQLSAVPHLAPKQDLRLPDAQSQSETSLTQAHSVLSQSNTNQHTAAVLCNTPVLSVSPSDSVSTLSTTPKLHTQLGSGRSPSLATAEHQRSFSAVPADNANKAPEAELSPMQRALRSLSSKGVQTNRSPSGKDSGILRDGSSLSPGKLSLRPCHGQHSPNEPEVGSDGQTQGWGGEGVQGVGAVRELASRLNLRSHSSKHMS